MAVSILGIGPVTALGSGTDSLIKGLNGAQKPNIQNVEIETGTGPVTLPVFRARTQGLDTFVSKRALRRVDAFARMALLSSHLSLADADMEIEDRSKLGIVFGSAHGSAQTTFKFLDGIIEDGDPGASPTHFANSVHNAPASQVSIFLKATGPCSTVTCFEQTVSQVLFTAETWLEQGAADYVLAGFGDEYCDVLGYTAAAMNSAPGAAPRPLRFDRCSYLPGEGHITFLLGKAERKARYGLLELKGLHWNAEQINGMLKNYPAVYLAANGDEKAGRAFQSLKLPETVHAHAPLFGSLPLHAAFELAAAAVRMQQANGPDVYSSVCLEYAGRDRFNAYELSGSAAS